MGADKPDKSLPPIEQLLYVMSRLRDPDGGCPWDLEQNYATIAPYTIEEAYEVADAITNNDMDQLKDELGDLLLQVVYHTQMASEDGAFDFSTVAQHVTDKMVHRHPHVFGDHDAETAGDVNVLWEERKEIERGRKDENQSALDGVAKGLPALLRAEKLQKRAARVGFEWPEITNVLDKIEEEIGELRREIATHPDNPDLARAEDELGDVLFALVNLARNLEINPESALRHTNSKFENRFKYIEQQLDKDGKKPSDASLKEMEDIWMESKTKISA